MRPQYRPRSTRPLRQSGITLIEIMVGVVIGLIGIIVIFQVLAVAEDRKRTVTGGTDAQVAGSIALYSLDRDVRLGGYGFGTAAGPQMGCTVAAYDNTRSGTQAFTFRLSPVVIGVDGSGGPDTITVLYGSSTLSIGARTVLASTGNTKVLQNGTRPGMLRGDLAIIAAAAGDGCALIEITDNTAPDLMTLDHAAAGTAAYIKEYPPANAVASPVRYNNPAGAAVATTGGSAYNLGPTPAVNVWQVVSGRLQFTNDLQGNLPTAAVPVANGIVNLKAEYGIDADGNNLVDNSEWTTTEPTTAAGWQGIRAIRVALLARSGQWDKNHCNPNPQWTSGATGALALTDFTMRNVDNSTDSFGCTPGQPIAAADQNPNNWRNYRYRVYETVIPLRNMIWGTAP